MKLSEFELDVMQHFWDLGVACSPDVHRLVAEEKDVAYTTVKTIVDRLEEKGALKRLKLEGRSMTYAPAITRESVTESALPSFLRRFFGGSSRELITQLIEEDKLSKSDIQYLQDVISKHMKRK